MNTKTNFSSNTFSTWPFINENATSNLLPNSTLNQSYIPQNCRLYTSDLGFLPWRNKNSLLSYEMLLLSGRILTGILTPLICMFGIPANIINCIVFYKLGLRQRINFLLFSHACTDLAFDLYSFVLFSESFCSQFVGITLNFYGPLGTFMLNSGLNTLYGFAYASGFLSTLIACERCFCIVRPLMVTWFLQTNTVCVAVCVTITALVCLHYIPSERYKLLCVFDPTARIAVQTYYPSDF